MSTARWSRKNERERVAHAAAVTPGGTFERVLAGLRQRLGAGTFALGDPLEPVHLAEDLNASITPVRDALHRLVGERLVEAAPGGGFRYPLLTEVGLRHLYDWNRRLLLMALGDAPRDEGGSPGDEDGATAGSGPHLFASIARLANNPECGAALAGIAARLESVRRKEDEILGPVSVEGEMAALGVLFTAGDWTALRRGIFHYHRRRARIVSELVESLHRSNATD